MMQIVIDIDEYDYKNLMLYKNHPIGLHWLEKKVVSGIPLPKGHGRLIDADRTALLSDLFCYTKYTGIDEAPYEDATEALAFAPTIIEADEEDNE